MTIKQTLLLTLFFSTAAYAKTLYVDGSFQGENYNGESWLSAFPTLQQAIEAANQMDSAEIWVKTGIYRPTDTQDRHATFALPPNTHLLGGFRGNETSKAQRNAKAHRTVLTGDSGKRSDSADNAYHVITGTSNSSVDGFVITAGRANGVNENGRGGAIYLSPAVSTFSIKNCKVEKNSAIEGGAIYSETATLTISNCTFYSNSSETKGGALMQRAAKTLSISDTIFTSNFAARQGGALMVDGTGSIQLAKTSFLYNTTEHIAGALFASAEAPNSLTIEAAHCQFQANVAPENGAALFLSGPSSYQFTHSTFMKNYSAQGASIATLEKRAHVALEECPRIRNRNGAGIAETVTLSDARLFNSVTALNKAKAVLNPKTNAKKVAAKPAPIKRRNLPDLFVLNESGTQIKLASILAHSTYTVLTTACLTDPRFIANYPSYEAAANAYAAEKVQFIYLYRYLAFPENHGFIPPFNLPERREQARQAQRLLHTQIPWYCDDMANQAAKWLESKKNTLFIFNADGQELFASSYSDKDGLLQTLQKLTGAQEVPPLTVTPSAIPPYEEIKTKYFKRPLFDVRKNPFTPLQVTPKPSKEPYYVKPRVEANKSLLETGDGKLYLGFHVDPLYSVAWDNFSEPVSYALKAADGSAIAPSINQARKNEKAPTDMEPREFILEVRKWKATKPIPLTVKYTIKSNEGKWKKTVTQSYIVYLAHDKNAGRVIGRQISLSQAIGMKKVAAQKKAAEANEYDRFRRRYDIDRNAKITRDEAPFLMRKRWNEVDTNQNDVLEPEEFAAFQEEKKKNR